MRRKEEEEEKGKKREVKMGGGGFIIQVIFPDLVLVEDYNSILISLGADLYIEHNHHNNRRGYTAMNAQTNPAILC